MFWHKSTKEAPDGDGSPWEPPTRSVGMPFSKWLAWAKEADQSKIGPGETHYYFTTGMGLVWHKPRCLGLGSVACCLCCYPCCFCCDPLEVYSDASAWSSPGGEEGHVVVCLCSLVLCSWQGSRWECGSSHAVFARQLSSVGGLGRPCRRAFRSLEVPEAIPISRSSGSVYPL